ncbi:MAG: attachment glycoprotein G, partial [Clostridia bacterium]|nr:attachment glycoprotein G [Clostridia bacterium]
MIKPSTIILLIISAVLIIAGVIMISTGNAMAKSKNINLFQAADEIDDQGRNFETHNLEDETEDVV